MHDNLCIELNNICDLKLFEKVITPTSCVENNKNLRIFFDPKNLDKAMSTSKLVNTDENKNKFVAKMKKTLFYYSEKSEKLAKLQLNNKILFKIKPNVYLKKQ